MQSALPAAVSWQGHRKVNLPLTSIIFDPMVHPCFCSKIGREIFGSGIYKWLRLCDLRDMENWPICDIFLKKQPEDEQEAKQSKQLSGAMRKAYIFQICPTRLFIA
ncbi:hypothetical protein [Clostridium sp. E02]|uniref:hypothetical protein n=1 Tax=Clostridium sp. E02 TaxID=2487134 RepID=UPI000F546CE1|nr:hypothetical protein [Clostridium sp. E02]